MGRREFLGAVGAAAAASRRASATLIPTLGRASALRIAVFREPGFPAVAGACDPASLEAALAGLDVTFVGVAGLAHLAPRTTDLLVLPYGSAFPKQAWSDLLGFLADGGNLLVLGGVPFAVPVAREGDAWVPESPQANYHKKIGLTHAYPVTSLGGMTLGAPDSGEESLVAGLDVRRAFAGYWRFTRTRSVPSEDGSDGEREAMLTPLVTLLDAGGTRLAAPVVQVDRLEGPFAGGRWVLAMCEGSIPAAALRSLAERAAGGIRRLEIRPGFAC